MSLQLAEEGAHLASGILQEVYSNTTEYGKNRKMRKQVGIEAKKGAGGLILFIQLDIG